MMAAAADIGARCRRTPRGSARPGSRPWSAPSRIRSDSRARGRAGANTRRESRRTARAPHCADRLAINPRVAPPAAVISARISAPRRCSSRHHVALDHAARKLTTSPSRHISVRMVSPGTPAPRTARRSLEPRRVVAAHVLRSAWPATPKVASPCRIGRGKARRLGDRRIGVQRVQVGVPAVEQRHLRPRRQVADQVRARAPGSDDGSGAFRAAAPEAAVAAAEGGLRDRAWRSPVALSSMTRSRIDQRALARALVDRPRGRGSCCAPCRRRRAAGAAPGSARRAPP